MSPTHQLLHTLEDIGVQLHTLIPTVPLPYQLFLLRAELEIKEAEIMALQEAKREAQATMHTAQLYGQEDTA